MIKLATMLPTRKYTWVTGVHANRQLNCALHRIALTQAHWHPDARAYIQRRKDSGDTPKEALRILKRRLSDVIYRAMLADTTKEISINLTQAA
jgi:ribosomal protein S4